MPACGGTAALERRSALIIDGARNPAAQRSPWRTVACYCPRRRIAKHRTGFPPPRSLIGADGRSSVTCGVVAEVIPVSVAVVRRIGIELGDPPTRISRRRSVTAKLVEESPVRIGGAMEFAIDA